MKIIQPLETGVVKTIFIKEGQHVKGGDKLIALDNTSKVADAERLVNELTSYKEYLARQLFNKYIGFVHTGQVAEIKIDSFPFTKYGVIDGTVTDISADAIEHEQFGLLFPLKASIKTDEINVDGKWIKLKPGMSVTVEIKTGTRRLMEFLLAPLMRGVSEGARER